jgi:DNA-binding PadR family transcriptional regulator
LIPETARARILTRYFRNQLVSSVPTITRLFRWERQSIFHTLGRLVREGIIATGIRVEGKDHRYYCLTERDS